ncbi:acyl-CoA Delta(11) desaturase-like [Achroia grisella]|uniref:acyl-CoA Delta(11) desaturase-like n=1 Tax=Achroia grisella TaxID=688607 RepID=UPI0027D24575|nr:acyl-CoA Delta(11) desaturase-like [Achroia grisella]
MSCLISHNANLATMQRIRYQFVNLKPFLWNINSISLNKSIMPLSTTQTSVIEEDKPSHCGQCRLNHSKDCCNRNNNNEIQYKDAHFQLLPKNELKFVRLIRTWEKHAGFITPIRWVNTLLIISFHIFTVLWFSYTMLYNNKLKWQSVLFGFLTGQIAGFGVTAGAHRYWCHRSYKAKLPLQLILLFCYSLAGQNSIFDWVRDHRVHHKFSETSADPHDVRRGFFFSHIGWLMMKKHPDVITEGSKTDMSDIINDPLVKFHTKYFNVFKIAICFVLPTLLPVYGWNEEWKFAVLSQIFVRYMMSLNFTWSVNSFAHIWGNKPYDKNIMPTENRGVSIVAMGEGWHNYHHTFPWDYKAAELAYSINVTTIIIDFFAYIGWAYDLKVASPSLIDAVAKNRGDGSRYESLTIQNKYN